MNDINCAHNIHQYINYYLYLIFISFLVCLYNYSNGNCYKNDKAKK